MIVIFSGTTEGRQLSHALAAEGIDIIFVFHSIFCEF